MSEHDTGDRRTTGESREVVADARPLGAQFELVVGSTSDPAEAEADLAAEAVLDRIRDGDHATVPAPFVGESSRVRRSARAINNGGPVDEAVEQRVRAASRGGSPMTGDLRRSMEHGFGADLSGVRMHTGRESDSLNDRFGARAFTIGPDIFFRGGQPDASTADGGRLIAHEVAHTIQQGAVVRRDGSGKGVPSFTKISRSDYTAQLQALVPTAAMKKKFDGYSSTLQKALTSDFGVKGMSWRRSKEARAWRQGLKDAGRQQARSDVDAALLLKNDINLATERAFYGMQAKQKVYATTKDSVATVLAEGVNNILEASWTDHENTLLGDASNHAQNAAWLVYKDALSSGKKVTKVQKSATSAAKKAALAHIAASYKEARQSTIEIKRKVMDKPNAEAATAAPASMQGLDQQVIQQVQDDDLGSKALDKVIEADSVTSGIGIFGKMLDQVVGTSGDQVSVSVEVRVPIMEGPGYVSFTLTGKAARGMDGAMTAGVPVFGDPRRLEVMVDLAFKVGADFIGLDLNAGMNFFVRGGGDDTALCMKAFSYGAYRTIAAVSGSAANWWAGADKATDGSKTQFAESWAAMLEEQAFKEGGAFVDIGAGLSGSAAAKFNAGGSGFEAGLSGGASAFWRYDEKALQDSLGSAYASTVMDKAAAEKRRSEASGRVGGSWGVNASLKAEIAGQGVGFAGSISGPMGVPAWGLEVSGTLTYQGGPTSTLIERYGAGCATAIASLVKNLIGLRKAKAGGVLDGAADVTQIVNSGLDNTITNALGSAWSVGGSNSSVAIGSSAAPDAVSGIGTSSTLTVAIIIGWDEGKPTIRLEIRSGKKLEINASVSGAGVKVSAEKTSRLLAVGYDKGGWDAEVFGVRAKKRKGQRETVGHRT